MFLPIRDPGAGARGNTTALIVQRADVRHIRKAQSGRTRHKSEAIPHRALLRGRAD